MARCRSIEGAVMMSDMGSYTAYKCPACAVTTPGMLWRETETYCDDCGSHIAVVCPHCDEIHDTVWTDVDEMIDVSLYGRAVSFAAGAHEAIDQRRKYSDEPYIVHPLAVADLLREVDGHTEIMLAAAVCHDVLEDTPVKRHHLELELGLGVADLVEWLTDVSTPADGTRPERKRLDREHIAAAPAEAQTIKLADLIDNTESIKARDPDFWRVYREEKLLLLEVLTRGDPALHARALRLCD